MTYMSVMQNNNILSMHRLIPVWPSLVTSCLWLCYSSYQHSEQCRQWKQSGLLVLPSCHESLTALSMGQFHLWQRFKGLQHNNNISSPPPVVYSLGFVICCDSVGFSKELRLTIDIKDPVCVRVISSVVGVCKGNACRQGMLGNAKKLGAELGVNLQNQHPREWTGGILTSLVYTYTHIHKDGF